VTGRPHSLCDRPDIPWLTAPKDSAADHQGRAWVQ
jgi:hypothetical protein